MVDYSIEQSEADTILFTVYAGLRQSGYSGPVVIDAADTDVYVAASVILWQLHGMLCIKRKRDSPLSWPASDDSETSDTEFSDSD